MKAVVLAAGEGRRLEPLTNRRPKPMLSIAGKPLLEYVLEAIAEAGIDDVVFVVGYARDRIQTHFGDGDDWGVDLSYVVQDKQLGTAHAISQAEDAVDDAFVVLNGDRILEPTCITGVCDALEYEGSPVMAVTRSADPGAYGVVELDGDRVVALAEKPHEASSELINAGVYGFEPSIFDAIRETDVDEAGERKITDTLLSYVEDGGVRAVRYSGTWQDVSHLWDVTRVTRSILDGGAGRRLGVENPDANVADATHVGAGTTVDVHATVRRGCSLGENVTVGANAVLSNAVVLADAHVADGAVVRDAVIAENATVGPNATVVGGESDVVVDGTAYEDVTLGAVVGDNARVGGGSTLQAGTVVGDDALVEAGCTVSGRIPSGTEVRRG
ncbi:NTP transferase domain-containing protein [Halorubellus sp. JP-L1]|uniref:sugar phosphate nucleotidyltransferase n=1 Tax=Halorubellus sp. JP-L1 TaxID=2715753 RepID=UPI0014081DD0|nr:NTP transferase domain-containing protein [Halorubellus sp. JP-L1]